MPAEHLETLCVRQETCPGLLAWCLGQEPTDRAYLCRKRDAHPEATLCRALPSGGFPSAAGEGGKTTVSACPTLPPHPALPSGHRMQAVCGYQRQTHSRKTLEAPFSDVQAPADNLGDGKRSWDLRTAEARSATSTCHPALVAGTQVQRGGLRMPFLPRRKLPLPFSFLSVSLPPQHTSKRLNSLIHLAPPPPHHVLQESSRTASSGPLATTFWGMEGVWVTQSKREGEG